MHFTPSQSLVGLLAVLPLSFASPLAPGYGHAHASGHAQASGHAHPTGSLGWPNGTSVNGTNSTGPYSPTVTVMATQSPPPAYAVTPVPVESYVPGPTLQPAVHWDHPVNDLQQLAPTNESSLYYASNGTADAAVEHMFASMNTTSQYQAVILAHSSYVKSVSCANDGVLVTFTDKTGFEYAANAWPDHGEDFVLVTYTDGCGNSSSSGQRTFWLIDSLTYQNETNAIDAKVTREIGIEDFFNNVDMVWGKYTPGADQVSSTSPSKSKRGGSDSVTKTADINLSAPTGDDSPWGGAALLFSEPGKVSVSNKTSDIDTEFKIFCVNCGIKSHFTLQGTAAWQYLPPKITKLTGEVDGNIVANFHLGMVATAEFDDTKTKNLFNEPIPDLGFSIGGVFEAGIYVTVDAVANLDITAEGQALAGVTMTVPDFKATLDMLDESSGSNSKITGFTPTWDKQFEVAGALGAKASLALPIGLHLGIKIIKIFDKSIALVEQPSLSAQAQIAGGTGGSSVPGVTCNNGVSYSVDAHNDITLNLFDVKTFNLEHADWNILSGCKQLPQSSTSTSSTATSTTEKPTSTHGPLSTGTGSPHSVGGNSTVPVGTGHLGTGVTSGHPKATGTGNLPGYGGNSTEPTSKAHGTGSAPKPTGTGSTHLPGYGGNSTEPEHTTKLHGTGVSSRPEATTKAYGTGVSSRPEATATHSIPGYGGKNNSTTTTSGKPEATETSTTTKLPGYGGEESASTSATSTHAEATTTTKAGEATTTKAPGYGGESSTTLATSTKPAAETTTGAPKYEQSSTTSHSSSSSTTTHSSTTTSSSSSSSTTTHSSTTTKAEATTTKAEATSEAAKSTKAAKTSKKSGY